MYNKRDNSLRKVDIMEQYKIERINELSKKQKSPEGLTESEKQEQAELRREYIDSVKRNLRAQLQGIEIKKD